MGSGRGPLFVPIYVSCVVGKHNGRRFHLALKQVFSNTDDYHSHVKLERSGIPLSDCSSKLILQQDFQADWTAILRECELLLTSTCC
jgi:hypothetical protein